MVNIPNQIPTRPFPDPDRQKKAKDVRKQAKDLSTGAPHPLPVPNRDLDPPYIFNFTKGMTHETNGLLTDPKDYETFVKGTEQHDPRIFACVPNATGPYTTEDHRELKSADNIYRQWESPTSGHAYVVQGPDAFAIKMPPAPEAGSAEFAAEMAEVYEMALLRDEPIASLMARGLINSITCADGTAISNACKNRIVAGNRKVAGRATRLGGMRWFQGKTDRRDTRVSEERERRRFGQALEPKKGLSPSTLFRGIGEDPWETPFLSQFMLMGTSPANPCAGVEVDRPKDRAEGQILYGNQRISQEVRVAVPNKDYMTQWIDFLEVQNGLNKRPFVKDCRKEEFLDDYRFVARLRDLATYVHDDALYQAYLNAALIMLGEGTPLDPGIPYHGKSGSSLSIANREPFALFGAPHLLTLVTEVSSRALKAVRHQKFSVHRRLRPEAAGALFHTIYSGYRPARELGGAAFAETGMSPDAIARRQLGGSLATYTFPEGGGTDPALEEILTDVRLHNAAQNGEDPDDLNVAKWLLPMAFPEGSPMHPAYGAGHATVAGACVTLLKAFFAMSERDETTGTERPVYLVKTGERALVPDGGTSPGDTTIDLLGVDVPEGLTLEGELNKLMWNISNGRNVAGVHYYTDYIESALLGEAITIGILREQMLGYHPEEKVTMTVPLLTERKLPAALLSGSSIGEDDLVKAVLIRSDGTLAAAAPTPGRMA